ncbi:DUF4175 domain-containing protein [Rhodobacter maris]|uniref:Uncharacterized protein (TIGR02302 family) n=1 Tax=Rhodobacter maris TaxID=446682 RepID=A0A285RK26_9RHOB|nr:DUF4175 domain-containing protein [Rhodobacter maris]SOB94496.1 uncharacterized protein (TIGR02302 family) [Rhodobacter maris]
MTPPPPLPGDPLAPLARPLRLTRAGLVLERALRAFWPLLSFLAFCFAALSFGLWRLIAPDQRGLAGGALIFCVIVLGAPALRRFRWPSRADAIARLDATLPGRPLSALTDALALGVNDPASRALWAVHLGRMAAAAAAARAPAPAPDLAPRDPFALRLSALTALALALVFGTPYALFAPVTPPGAPGSAEAAMGPAWEGWAEPPRYTGRPGIYLNGVVGEGLTLPEGTRLAFRFYGAPGAVPFTETVSSPAAPPADAPAETAGTEVQSRDFTAVRSGIIELGGPMGRRFAVTVAPDAPPAVDLPALAERRADGKMAQPFSAADDYGVVRGHATISLDLAAVDRRFGLSVAPEPRADLVFDLPLPISGSRATFAETLVEDVSEHPWANLPVKLTLEVEDGRGQTGQSATETFDLPGRRFFDPRAAALIELRRDLLWSRANAARSAQILRALLNRPEDTFPAQEMVEVLHGVVEQLEAVSLTQEARDAVAGILWQMAELLEDGGLADALEAMQQAQARLSEAIRNGASKDEIAKLMAELKEATDRYIEMLAERSRQEEQGPQFGQQHPGQQITGDQIQALMDQIQKLMEEGRMAEAQELLDQLARMMENMKVTQGQGGSGSGPGGQTMQDLGQTLRDQQQLSDDAFRQMQRPPGGGAGGEDPQTGAGGAEGDPGANLAGRQHALRRELERQKGLMPRLGGEAAEAGRQALDEAGRAMDGAEEALRRGDIGRAIDGQADAIEALREGMRQLGEAFAGENADGTRGEGDLGQQRAGDATGGQGTRMLPRDPLGRATGEGSQIGSEGNMLQGEDVYRRARDLLEEIRRRTAERSRPEAERNYLRRLLDSFAPR